MNTVARASWYDRFKNHLRDHLSTTSPVYKALNLVASVIDADEKLFAMKEVVLSLKYGQTFMGRPQVTAFNRLSHWLGGQEVDLVDIGARHGWFTRLSPRFFNVRHHYAYEPVEACNAHLEPLKRQFPDLKIRNVLLGDKIGEQKFYHYKDGGNSSIYKFHSEWEQPSYVQNDVIETPTLPQTTLPLDLASLGCDLSRPLVIKIDTQGAELDILEGARKLFEAGHVIAVVAEVQAQPIYEGTKLWIDVLRFLDEHGLVLLDTIPGLRKTDETINELDIVYVKRKRPKS